ncbi:MAG: hypothetical protein M1816_000323 [Peltula sp. TS41687]|nr:MAG: hypothetical protein M1816_000323 [Peltula sp. TS41687]
MSGRDAFHPASAADSVYVDSNSRQVVDDCSLREDRSAADGAALGQPPPTTDNRRHSFPLNLLLPNVWSPETSVPSLAASEQAASGETTRDEITAAHRAAALRQLNGAPKSRQHHRQSNSTGAGNTTFSHPVIVRTYSGATTSEQRQRIPIIREEHDMDRPELPSVEAFSFEEILKNVEPDISGALDAIAGICANSRYSLSNHYEVHMPPQGSAGQGHPTEDPGLRAGRAAGGTMPDTTHAASRRTDTIVLSVAASHQGNSGRPSRRQKPAGKASRSQEAAHERSMQGNVAIGELEFYTIERDGSSARQTTSPMALIDSSTKHRSTQRLSNSSDAPGRRPSGLTAAPAPEVLTESRRAKLVIEGADGRSLHDPSETTQASSAHGGEVTDGPNSQRRRSSVLGNFTSWLPWGVESDERESRRASRNDREELLSPYTAEGRLRGLLISDGTV